MKRRSTRRSSARAQRAGRAFARLVRIMAVLRSPAGCPWDREQTAESLRPFLLEETYEALDAIDRGDLDSLAGELGDVLFQCVFQAQIAAEQGRYEIADAVQAIIDKLVHRHPHVFTPSGRPLPSRRRRAGVRTPGAVVEQWERLKAREQTAAGNRPSLLAGVPRTLPALARANEIGVRVAAVGFDWPAATDVVTKIEEETRELRSALDEGQSRAAEELGDVLFSMANLARKLGIDPEAALRQANDKFTDRFSHVERRLLRRGRSLHEATLDELEAAWASVKDAAARTTATTVVRSPSRSTPPRRRSRARRRRRGRS